MPALSSTLGAVLGFFVVVALLFFGFSLWPDGANYPFPVEAYTATVTLYSWLLSFNMIFPVDTLATILAYSVLLQIFTRFVWPIIMWLLKVITGGGQ